MGEAFIIGAAMTTFGKHRDSSYAGLGVPPLVEALRCAGISRQEVGAVYCGNAYGGMLTGQRICKVIGLGGIPGQPEGAAIERVQVAHRLLGEPGAVAVLCHCDQCSHLVRGNLFLRVGYSRYLRSTRRPSAVSTS